MQQKDQNISQEVQQNDQNVIPESETKRSKLIRITCVSVSSKGREEIFLTQFASGLRRLAFFVSCSRVSFCFVFARCCSAVLSARLSAIVCIVLSKVVGKSRLSLSSRCCILSL